MRKNLFPLFLFFALACIGAQPICASGEVYDRWDGTDVVEPTKDLSGAYVIHQAAELAWIASQEDEFAGQTFSLNANIDINGHKWRPIGSAAHPFRGVFLGNGKLIRGLRSFEGTDGLGLFGHVGQGATIEQIGISGGVIAAPLKRRVGALAGVCAGVVSECWSMAEIAIAGTVVGGLVGELNTFGSLTDCYNAGLILNASDTIGGIVGYMNGGKLNRVYLSGYARNGMAIVGIHKSGSYKDCYFDRKLYYQQAGVVNDGIKALDKTEEMFDIFAEKDAWLTNTDDKRYPTLKAFDNTDASLVSSATMFIEKESKEPVNHANTLMDDFTLNTRDGVKWKCQDKPDEEWIQISGENVHIVHPCSETDVLLNSTLGSETRVVYVRPIKLRDFQRSFFNTNNITPVKGFCFGQEAYLGDNVRSDSARYGWKYGDYHYMVTRDSVTQAGDTVPMDTLQEDCRTWKKHKEWLNNYQIDTKTFGTFVIRRWVHDERCVPEWNLCYENEAEKRFGKFVYTIFQEFDPGKIEDKTDTIFLSNTSVVVQVDNVEEASGGGGPITYQWYMNGISIGNATKPSLEFCELSTPGTYVFRRMAKDSADCATEDKRYSEGTRTIVVFNPFDPGKLTGEKNITFCTVAEAQYHTVEASSAHGGSGKYSYQWYLLSDGDETPIKDGTKKELDLDDFTLEPGEDYTFMRRAEDDTRFTDIEADSCISEHTQTIHIMAELKPGAIEDEPLSNQCVAYDADASTTLTINISEEKAAKGDKELEYRWRRMPDGKLVGDEKELNYTFPISEIRLGTTYTYYREVRNKNCQWQQSEGEVTQYYGRGSHAETTISICDEQLPYTISWSSADGKQTESFTFRSATDTWLVSDKSFDCPADTLFRIQVMEVPELVVEQIASFCQTSGTITLSFEQTAGMSDLYRITYSDNLTQYIGQTETTGVITIPGTIILENIPSIGVGDNYLLLQIGYSDASGEGVCFSRAQRLDIHASLGGYVYSKYDRVIFVDNNPDNGALGTAQKLKFEAYQWYKNGIAQEGQTGQYYHEGGQLLTGVFYVMLTDTEGRQYRSCEVVLPAEKSSANAQQVSLIYPVPVGAEQPLTIEGFGEVQILSASGECVHRITKVDGRTIIKAPRVAGMYYVQITTEDGDKQMHKLIVK